MNQLRWQEHCAVTALLRSASYQSELLIIQRDSALRNIRSNTLYRLCTVDVVRLTNTRTQDEEMRLREVEEAEKKQMMKERQQKLLEGQLVRSVSVATPPVRWGFPRLYCGGLR